MKKERKERADILLVGRGLAETRQKAQALIMAGLVSSAGRRVEKPGQLIDPDTPLLADKPLPYVGRGGLKLEQALDAFEVGVRGRICADIGSSTGGFTDCLLQRGAARVYAVDVDIRQLDDRLRRDPRVVTLEKNARRLVPADFAEPPSLAVMDVSFISILKILPALRAILSPAADAPARGGPATAGAPGLTRESMSVVIARGNMPRASGEPKARPMAEQSSPLPILLTLVKPQFEAGRGNVGKKGIVRDPAVHVEVLTRIAAEAAPLGFALRGLVRCAARGQKGNQEFFARWAPGGMEPAAEDVIKWIREAVPHETD